MTEQEIRKQAFKVAVYLVEKEPEPINKEELLKKLKGCNLGVEVSWKYNPLAD